MPIGILVERQYFRQNCFSVGARVLSKAIRKDYLGWPATELEIWLPALLENMRFSEIKVKGATRRATACVKDHLVLPTGSAQLTVEISITWTEQSDGLTFIVSVEEPRFDWTGFICTRMADAILGALRTVCECYHGKDA